MNLRNRYEMKHTLSLIEKEEIMLTIQKQFMNLMHNTFVDADSPVDAASFRGMERNDFQRSQLSVITIYTLSFFAFFHALERLLSKDGLPGQARQ